MSYLPPEPRLARLTDLLEDRLDPAEAARVRCLLEGGGPRARHAMRWATDFLSLAAAVPLFDPPPAVHERLLRSFAACQQATAELAETSIEVTLALLFDSSRDQVLAGTRSGDVDDDVVHLAFASEQADLVLDITSTGPGTLRIEGQILPLDTSTATAGASAASTFESLLSLEGFEPRAARCDIHGRFSFDGVRPGPQRLRTGNGRLSLVADLNLREPWVNPTTTTTPRSTQASRGAS